MSSDRIQEGFICPICMLTLDRQEDLIQHVSTQHPDDDEDVLGQVKGWIGRMGKKLKAKGEEMTASAIGAVDLAGGIGGITGVGSGGGGGGGGSGGGGGGGSNSTGGGGGSGVTSRRSSVQANYAFYEDPNHFQEPGKAVSHTEEFLRLRAQRISHAHREQDRLLLRLEKLMRVVDTPPDAPAAGLALFAAGSAAVKRKAAQKALVPWAADKDVPLCPICAAEFNRLTRRKHHCRLCGFVMCGECSNFLSEAAARRLVTPTEEAEEPSEPEVAPSFLSRSNSETSIASLPLSLNSYMPWTSNSPPTGDSPVSPRERTLRVCSWCRAVLEGAMRQHDKGAPTPMLVQLYEQLQSALQAIKDEIGGYEEMLNAVNQGRLEDLNSLSEHRNRLLRLANFADDCSRQITTLPTPTDRAMAFAAERGAVLPKTGLARLQANVRSMAAHTLTNSPALRLLRQQLPSPEECARRVKETRRAAQRQREEGADGLGWTPGAAPPELCEDPLEQQMANIREYARLARDAGKYEELMMLEENLRMLEAERRARR